MTPLRSFLDRRARRDPAVFASVVGRDETTGRRIKLVELHRGMHELWEQHERSVLWCAPEFGKTTQAILRVAWMLGLDPTLRAHWTSNSAEAAAKSTMAVARVIESDAYRRIFPEVRIERQVSGGFTLTGRSASAKDPSLMPLGLGNASGLGSRIGLLVADDVLGLDETLTPAGRDKAWAAWSMVHMSRLAPGGRVMLMGTAWHSDDVLHRAAALPTWASRRYPIEREDGSPSWPERWPPSRIAERRRELGPHRSRTSLDCEPIDGSSLVFPSEHIAEALRKGENAVSEHFSPRGSRQVLGVDVAFSTSATSDESALVLVRVLDDGSREVAQAWTGRWTFDQLCTRIVDVAQRHRALVAIESNGGGRFVHEQVSKHVASVAFPTTASSKAARTEWLSAEMASGRWSIRHIGAQLPEQSRQLCEELLAYSPEAHCGDRLAALFLAVEGIRQHKPRPKARWHNIDMLTR